MNSKAIYEYYWMRPENALWRARDFQVLEDVKFEHPILDFGAGDGAFSFLRAGGRLSPHYDAFSETMDTSNFFRGADIYDQFNNLSSNVVQEKANYRIDVAFDLKANLLSKAEKLDFYDQIVVGNGNDLLPFSDGHFKTVFSNILYWLKDPLGATQELSRITESGGKIVLTVPSDQLSSYSFYKKYFLEKGRPAAAKFLELLDFGRLANNIKVSKSGDDWENIFAQCGLEVTTRRNYISGALARLWDIGLRPFSPFMIEMANKMGREERAAIKARWVDETYELFKGFLDVQADLEKEEPTAFFMFVLTKT